MPQHDTARAVVFLDDQWRRRSPEEFARDWLDPLLAHPGLDGVTVGGAAERFASVLARPKVRVHAGDAEADLLRAAAADAAAVLRLRHHTTHRFPLTARLIDAALDGAAARAPGGYFQLDCNDLPYPPLTAEVLGAAALAALAGGTLTLDWATAAAGRSWPFPVASASVPHAVRLDYLDNPDVGLFRFPRFVALEASRLCNLRCTMCALHSDFIDHSHTDDHPKHFDLGRYRALLDQLEPYRDDVNVAPQFWGEPFMSPHLRDMITYARHKGIRLCFTTNGTLWDDELIDFMIREGVNLLCVSLDGATRETYEQVRIGARFETVVRNLNRLIERKQALGSPTPYLQINMALFPENRHEQDRLIQDWLGRANVVSISNHCVNNVVPELHFRPERIPCPTLWEGMHINTNGDVIACCNDTRYEEVMGNVFTTPILDVWNNEKYRDFRGKHLRRQWTDIPMCVRCDSWACKTRQVVRQGGLLIHQTPFYRHFAPAPGECSETPVGDAAATVLYAVREAGAAVKRTLVNLSLRRRAS